MRFVQDHDVIQALPAHGADHALDIRVLPRARRRGHDFSDAHARHAALEGGAIDAITISVDPGRCRVVRKGVDHLLCGPLGVRWAVMFRCTIRRRWWHRSTHTNSTRPVRVGTVKKSIDAADAR